MSDEPTTTTPNEAEEVDAEAEATETEAEQPAAEEPDGRGDACRRGAASPRRSPKPRPTKPRAPRRGRAAEAEGQAAKAAPAAARRRPATPSAGRPRARQVRPHVRPQGAPRLRPHPRQVRRRGARDPRHTPARRRARLGKLLESAVANAEHNHELVGDDLRIAAVVGRRGPDAQALPPARHGPRDADPQAHEPPHDHAHAEGVAQMGQKVHPESMRVGYIHDWKSNWFNERHFADYLAEDVADPRPHHRQARARRPVRHHDPQGRQRGRGQHPHGPSRAS